MKDFSQYITHIWNLRTTGKITVYEQDLYLYLLQRAHDLDSLLFFQSTEVLCAVLGINRNALGMRRQRLKELGLINYVLGEGRKTPPRYTLRKLSPKRKKALTDKPKFTPPTYDEVLSYCNARNSVIDARRFFNYYHAKAWKIGNRAIEDWKTVVQTWEQTEFKKEKSATLFNDTAFYEQF